ncbi:haloacid dehalogenase type II [Pseudomonas luteola]|uniref:haloacid dehalogenase type II n=1 Tax=Pseudomonas luteola TaxID=47886 RepID=UPI000F76C5E5|nr:haloacid dehalogenase type II [Pseudomonas luteola]RRW46581.1 haloacid dehalogenase type II [Pseudomonas luteola]
MKTTVHALLFDVFGTVVDWRGSLIASLESFGEKNGLKADWPALVDAWRAEAYGPLMDEIRERTLPWTPLDDLHRVALEELLPQYGLVGLTKAEVDWIHRLWHRLNPWPDAVPGLTRLKQGYSISALSNGNVAMLVNMARHGGLPWDMVFGADLFNHYKPDAECYLGACTLLGLEPERVMLCAAHNNDLQAASELGLRTAFIQRPLEKGPKGPIEQPADSWDLVVSDLQDLADQLGMKTTTHEDEP